MATPTTIADPPGGGRRRVWAAIGALAVVAAALTGWEVGRPAPTELTLASQAGLYADALRRVPEAPPSVGFATTSTTPPPPEEPALRVGTGYASAKVLGTISIPKLGVKVNVLEGIQLWVIDQGSGHWPGTPMPGQLGNVVVAGHRTLYQRPFHNLDQLVAGDRVVFEIDGQTWTYEVRGIVIVPANAVDIVNQHDAHTATLFACHPKGSATHRIVAKLRLLDANGRPVDPDSALPPIDLGTGSGPHYMEVQPGVALPNP